VGPAVIDGQCSLSTLPQFGVLFWVDWVVENVLGGSAVVQVNFDNGTIIGTIIIGCIVGVRELSGQGLWGLDIPADQDRMLCQSSLRSIHAGGTRALKGLALRVVVDERCGSLEGASCAFNWLQNCQISVSKASRLITGSGTSGWEQVIVEGVLWD